MLVREVRDDEKDKYNSIVSHPIQSWEWGEFKKKTSNQVVRLGIFDKQRMSTAYQVSFHSIPKLSYTIGYFPKGPVPDRRMLEALVDLGAKKKAIFIKLEPNVKKVEQVEHLNQLLNNFDLRSAKSVFTPHTFQIDLTPSEEELMAKMKAKTRYNVRLAERNGVKVYEDNSTFAFETYLRLTRETSLRQGFYAHDEEYHRKMWEVLQAAGMARLLVARYKEEILTTWIVFVFQDVLYYPYGASSSEHRNLMANNLIMWEAMKFGKQMGCSTFDLWGSLGPDPDPKDPWYGFHRFKEGYGGELVEFVGTFDLVLLPQMYSLYELSDNIRWKWLRLRARFR